MKKKILMAIGALFSLAVLFSACSADNSSAPSVAIPTSSEDSVPASSANTNPQSSESLESSSSKVFLPSSGSWYDGNSYNPRACCADTVYIEDGKERVHMSAEGVCPPPSIMTVTCKQPVRVDMDSIKAAEENKFMAFSKG